MNKYIGFNQTNQKLHKEIAEFRSDINGLVHIEDLSLDDSIEKIIAIRHKIYEQTNQILHEYYVSKAIQYLESTGISELSVNARQTGTINESDIRIRTNENKTINCEVTTSLEPKGVIDSKMKRVLEKLSDMKGRKIYFVISDKMEERAKTKIEKMKVKIDVINLRKGK